jgi:hypothetical protein
MLRTNFPVTSTLILGRVTLLPRVAILWLILQMMISVWQMVHRALVLRIRINLSTQTHDSTQTLVLGSEMAPLDLAAQASKELLSTVA